MALGLGKAKGRGAGDRRERAAHGFISCRSVDGGGVEAIFAPAAETPLSFRYLDRTGEGQSAEPRFLGHAGLAEVDLLAVGPRKGPAWKPERSGKDIKSGVDFAEAWTIPGEPTWWLRSESTAPVAFRHLDAETRGATPIAPGGEYRCRILAAAHRCRAEVRLTLIDRGGRALLDLHRPVSPTAKGGKAKDGYDAIEMAFQAPPGAAGVEIAVVQGGAAADSDSFLFVAAASLTPGLEDTAHQPLSPQAVAEARRIARSGRVLKMAWLPGPGRGEAQLSVDAGAESFVSDWLAQAAEGRSEASEPPQALIVSSLKAAIAYNRLHDADGRHARAYRLWLERAERGEPIPDLEAMKQVLDTGAAASDIRVAFDKESAPEVSVILEASADLATVLASLVGLRFAACAARFEVIVVAPDAEAAKALKACAKGVEVVHGRGAGAIAAAVAKARAPRLVLAPDGWEPVAGWLDELLAVFGGFDGVVAAGPKLIEHDGRLAAAGLEVAPKGLPAPVGADGNPRDPAFGHVRPVDAVYPLMIDRDAWQSAGGLDEAFEDRAIGVADLCLRLAHTGGRVAYCPTAEAWRLKDAPAQGGADEGDARTFKARWSPRLSAPALRVRHGGLNVLFVDQEAPTVDMDAGGYAAFQEIRMLQALGARVSFLPKNLAWMDRHTLALQRAGVECHYAPFVSGFDEFFRDHANDYDLIFVLRYKVARLVQAAMAPLPKRPKLVLNLADLHFLREIREAALGTSGFDEARARETQAAELAAIEAADLTLTYSDVEAAVIESHTFGKAKVARAPWVVETRASPISAKAAGETLTFLGGFGHPPNAEAVRAFVRDVMPLITQRRPAVKLSVVGSKATPEVLALAGPHVDVVGYAPDLDEVFAQTRVFVAPLLAGAGLKGKVIEALSRGVPCVLSPIAAEGTGLVDGVDCLIAETPQAWAEAVDRLLTDRALWTRIAEAGLAAARKRFSFEAGVDRMREALALIGVYGDEAHAFHYRHALPGRSMGASAAPAVLTRP